MKDQKDKILNALLLTAIAMLFVGVEVAVWFGVIGIRIAGTAIIAGLAIYTFDYLDQEREEKDGEIQVQEKRRLQADEVKRQRPDGKSNKRILRKLLSKRH